MSSQVEGELQSFHKFVEQKLEDSEGTDTPEEVLEEWRERQATLESIKRGLNDLDSGRVHSASDVISELRSRLANT